jgi:putative DNA primase/helicase
MSDSNDDLGDISNIIKLAELTSKPTVLVTEDSAALAFADTYRGQLLFDHDTGSWFRWSGNHWRQERTLLAFDWARGLVRDLTENEAIKIKALGRKSAFISGVERITRTDRCFAITADDWNRDPFLLATPGGTVELRTGRLRAPTPSTASISSPAPHPRTASIARAGSRFSRRRPARTPS